MIRLLFFRADSFSFQTWQPISYLVDCICLNTKNCKKERKSPPACPRLAGSFNIISIAGGVPGSRGPAWLAGLGRERRAGPSQPQARCGRPPPPGLRWQRRPCRWGRPLCCRCHFLSCCLRHLPHRTQAKLFFCLCV